MALNNLSPVLNRRQPIGLQSTRFKRENNPDVEIVPLVPAKNDEDRKPPLAGPETDEDSDEKTVITSQPGVDDGFFTPPEAKPTNNNTHDHGVGTDDDDISNIGGEIVPRAGSDENNSDKPISANNDGMLHPANFPRYPSSYAPSFGHDIEGGGGGVYGGSFVPDLDASLPDVNVYQHKKTLAQGMMDLALFSANANQLRYVLESFNRHPYYYPSIVLLSISLIFQVAVGIGLIWNATYNVKDQKEICVANRINNFTVIGIFLVTVVNVFISAFGVANNQPATVSTTGT